MVAKLNMDDSERTAGFVMLPRNQVTVIEEDSPEPNRISVTLVKASDGTCIGLPNPDTFGGGIWCTTGSAVPFDTVGGGPTERVLTVPYRSPVPETVLPVRWVQEQWWTTSRRFNTAAETCLANNSPMAADAVAPYGPEGMLRLKVSGLAPYPVWLFHKKHGFQRSIQNAITHWWIAPPPENGTGYPAWMAPHIAGPTGTFASAETQASGLNPTYGGFAGHANQIVAPFAGPGTDPSTRPTRSQIEAGGGGSRGSRTPSETPLATNAAETPSAGAGGGDTAMPKPANAPLTGAAGGSATKGSGSAPAVAPPGGKKSEKKKKTSGDAPDKGGAKVSAPGGASGKEAADSGTLKKRNEPEQTSKGPRKSPEPRPKKRGNTPKPGGSTSGSASGKKDVPPPPTSPPPPMDHQTFGEMGGTSDREVTLDRSGVSVTATRAPTFPIILDNREHATTFISANLYAAGLAADVNSPSGRTLVRLRFGPDLEDCLLLPKTGPAIGPGTTSRVAMQDALTFDGLGFRIRDERPDTWLIQTTKGNYTEPRQATEADVNHGEIWRGLGAVDLLTIPENRGRVLWARCLYRSPHLEFREWCFRDSQNDERPSREWDRPTIARLQRGGVESVQHLRRLGHMGFLREWEHMMVIDPVHMPERKDTARTRDGPGSGWPRLWPELDTQGRGWK